MTGDVEAAKASYGETIGWSFDAMPMDEGTYWVAMRDGKPAGGIIDMAGVAPDGALPHWFSYLTIDGIDARIAQAASAGGQGLRTPFDVPGVGRIAIVQDAAGAAIGWITPD